MLTLVDFRPASRRRRLTPFANQTTFSTYRIWVGLSSARNGSFLNRHDNVVAAISALFPSTIIARSAGQKIASLTTKRPGRSAREAILSQLWQPVKSTKVDFLYVLNDNPNFIGVFSDLRYLASRVIIHLMAPNFANEGAIQVRGFLVAW